MRGAISAALVLEAIAVLLAIAVAQNTGSGTGAAGVGYIVVLALALIGACVYVKRSWHPWLVAGLQVAAVAGWWVNASLGVVGIIFTLVFAVIYGLRFEYRRRDRAGLLPGQPNFRG
nr:DUF4233 domain-containing protein [Nakamurella aerolata]